TTGQSKPASFALFESFLDFDTSTIPVGSTINSVSLQLWGTTASGGSFTAQVYLFDYGSSLTTADWVDGSTISALPLLATFATSGVAFSAYNTFAENGTVFRSNINA